MFTFKHPVSQCTVALNYRLCQRSAHWPQNGADKDYFERCDKYEYVERLPDTTLEAPEEFDLDLSQ